MHNMEFNVDGWLTMHRSSFLTGTQDSHLQTVTIPETACIQL